MIRYAKAIDKYAWRCNNSACKNYQCYYSLRGGSFFEKYRISFEYIFRIILKYGSNTPQHAIIKSLNIADNTMKKVMNEFIAKIPETDFKTNKLGVGGLLVQVDETMLNLYVSHIEVDRLIIKPIRSA
ncbi:hypothetical protein BDAP_002471 [Binucleata daphniae]